MNKTEGTNLRVVFYEGPGSAPLASDCWQHSTTAIPEARWACFEWHFDGPNNKMEFWLDSTQIQMWIDDVALDVTRVGCQ